MTEIALTLLALLGHDVALEGLAANDLAGTGHAEALGGTFMRLHLGHGLLLVLSLILAFAGGSVNTLVLFYAYAYSYTQIINMYDIAIEIMQGISASLGVVLTVPFVSAVAAWMISRTADSTCRDRGKPQDGNLI